MQLLFVGRDAVPATSWKNFDEVRLHPKGP
jgi:hypothetical protein